MKLLDEIEIILNNLPTYNSSRQIMEEVGKELMALYTGTVPSEQHVMLVKNVIAKMLKALTMLEK